MHDLPPPVAIFEVGSERLAQPPEKLDPFALFGLPRRAVLDESALRAPYLALSRRIHPDRFTAAGPEQIARAEAWAAALNRAYQTLKSARLRLLWLLGEAGMSPAESGGEVPRELLAEVFELRETLEDLGGAAPSESVRAELSARRGAIATAMADCGTELSQCVEAWDAASLPNPDQQARGVVAAKVARTLGRERFWARLLNEVDAVLGRKPR